VPPEQIDPLTLPLRQYGFVFLVAIFGGLVSWYGKVRAGKFKAGQLGAMVGELTTSAFAGLLAFWACLYFSVPSVLSACLIGLAGHLGGKFIVWLEDMAKKRADAALGNP
jgi:hypothetical protein